VVTLNSAARSNVFQVFGSRLGVVAGVAAGEFVNVAMLVDDNKLPGAVFLKVL
jgi:hypothetical protein